MEKKKIQQDELWQMSMQGQTLDKFVKNTADTHKIIIYGETSVGKTRFWMGIPTALAKLTKPEDTMICAIYPDRATGITKLAGSIPPEYATRIKIYQVGKYEDLIKATATAVHELMEHYKKTGKHGWLITELLGEEWMMAQDYYVRQSYGQNLGNYFATKKQLDKAVREDASAYKALDGWKDWPVIKFFHNFYWIDKIKLMPFNVLFTAEIKAEARAESMFVNTGRPGGEKDNMHRVDDILLLTKSGTGKSINFFMQPMKMTGYTAVYPKQNITKKNAFSEHLRMMKRLEDEGYKQSIIKSLEEEAGIEPPKKPKKSKKESKVEEAPQEEAPKEPVKEKKKKEKPKEEIPVEPEPEKPVEEKPKKEEPVTAEDDSADLEWN